MSCNVQIACTAPTHFRFDQYDEMKKHWYIQRHLQPGKLQILISVHSSTEGFWITVLKEPLNEDFDIIYRDNKIIELFNIIDEDYNKTGKVERQFWISANDVSGGIKSIGGLIISVPEVFQWMFLKTLKQIKPWILKQPNYKVEECAV